MVEGDTRAEEAQAGAGPGEPSLLGSGLGRVAGADATDARGRRLRGDLDGLISDDGPDVGVASEWLRGRCRTLEGEALEGVLVDVGDRAADALHKVGRLGLRVVPGTQRDDPAGA